MNQGSQQLEMRLREGENCTRLSLRGELDVASAGAFMEQLSLVNRSGVAQLTVDLSDLIERNAAFAPNKPALHFEGETLSYRALVERIDQTARAACATTTPSGGPLLVTSRRPLLRRLKARTVGPFIEIFDYPFVARPGWRLLVFRGSRLVVFLGHRASPCP